MSSNTNNSADTMQPESLSNSSSNTNTSSSTGSTSSSSNSSSGSSSSNSSSNTNSSSNSSSNSSASPPPKKSQKKAQSAKKNKGKSAAKSAKKNNTQKNKKKKRVTIVEGVNKTAALQSRRAQALKNLTAALGKPGRVGNAATLTSMRNKGASEEEIKAFIEKVRTGQTFKTGKKESKSSKKNKGKSSKANNGKSSKKNKNKSAKKNNGKSSKKNKTAKKNKKAKNLLKTQVPANNATSAAPKTATQSDKFKQLMERRATALANLSKRFEGTSAKAKVGNAATLTALRNRGASEEEQEAFIQRALRGETMKPTGRTKALTAIAEGDEELPTATSVKEALTQAATAARKTQKQLEEAKKTSKKATAAAAKEQKAIEDLAKKEADRIEKAEKARRLVDLETQAAENLRGATGKNAKKANTRKLAALRNSGLDFSVQEYLKMKAAIRTLKNRGFRNGSGIVEGPGGKKFICENCKPVTGPMAEEKVETVAANATSADVRAASAQTNPLAEATSEEIIDTLDE